MAPAHPDPVIVLAGDPQAYTVDGEVSQAYGAELGAVGVPPAQADINLEVNYGERPWLNLFIPLPRDQRLTAEELPRGCRVRVRGLNALVIWYKPTKET
jgi:hypothetical protein